MSGGGIIIRRYTVLRTTANEPSLYGSLDSARQAIIDAISAKAPADVTASDVQALAVMVLIATYC